MHVIDYIKQFDSYPVSPIWGGKQAFHFLCLGHLDISKALGFELVCATPMLTVVKEHSFASLEELHKYFDMNQPDYELLRREADYILENRKWFPDEMCGGGCFGPLTVVSGILGAEKMLRMIVKAPEIVEEFVAYVTDYMIELALLEKAKGQDFFWIAEPLASLLAPKHFWRFSGQYLKKIFEAAGAPGFLHVCGSTAKHTELLVKTGAEVLSIDSCTDIGECISKVNENVVIMGNVSPVTLRHGTKEEVREEIEDILRKCRGRKNLILSTGCSIMPGTPDENMAVMFEDFSQFYGNTKE